MLQETIVKNYVIVKTKKQVEELLSRIELAGSENRVITFDTETTGLNTRKDTIIGFSLCETLGYSFYFPVWKWNLEKQELVELQIEGIPCCKVAKKILQKLVGKKLVMHNASFDCRITKHYFGVDLLPNLYADTIMLVHTLQEEGVGRNGQESFGLKKIAIALQEKLGLDVEKAANEEQIELRQSIAQNGGSLTRSNYELYKADLDIIGKYAAADTDLTLRVYNYYIEKLYEEGLDKFFFEEEVMPLYKEVTVPMEERGIAVDLPLLEKTKTEILVDMEKQKKVVISTLLKDEPGQRWVVDTALKNFPPRKSGAWATSLIDRYSLPFPKSEKTGKYSITKANVAKLDDGWQKEFLETGDENLIPEKEKVRISLALWKDANDGDYFNVQSATQLAEIVFKYYGEKPIKSNEETGKDSFDGEVIQVLSKKYPWVEALRVYRKLQKIYTTYVERFLTESEDGIYYPYWLQNGTVSGRYASNMQQLPHPMEDDQDVELVRHYNHLVRQFLIARPGYKFLDADYESLEPHCFASVSGDEGLRDIFRNGWDFYSTIAIKTEKLDQDSKKYPDGVSADKKSPVYLKKIDPTKRQSAKGYALGVPYGMSGFALGKRLGISTKEAQKLVEGYLGGFPNLKKWYDGSREFMYKNGYIKTLVGRIRHLPRGKEIYDAFGLQIMDYKFRQDLVHALEADGMSRSDAEKEVMKTYMDFKSCRNNCLNVQLQSLGASVVGRAAVAIMRKAKELNIEAYPIAQIHDQLVLEVEESKASELKPWMEKLMAETTKLPGVDLAAPAEIGNNMYETH